MAARIAVVDGMGGGIGAQLVSRVKPVLRNGDELIALGVNALATAAMLKVGATVGATGENAITFNISRVQLVLGPIGIVIPNSLYGEVTPAIASVIASTPAIKMLVPLTQPHFQLIGLESGSLNAILDELASKVASWREKIGP